MAKPPVDFGGWMWLVEVGEQAPASLEHLQWWFSGEGRLRAGAWRAGEDTTCLFFFITIIYNK